MAMKWAGQPKVLAPAYVLLASENASFITGQIVHVNGGEVVNGYLIRLFFKAGYKPWYTVLIDFYIFFYLPMVGSATASCDPR